MTHPILHRPVDLAHARQRRRIVLFTLALVSVTAVWFVSATRTKNPVCHVDVAADGTWTPVDFDASDGIPANCELALWKAPQG